MDGLNSLNSWGDNRAFFAPRSAQGYLSGMNFSAPSCGSACGSGDPKPQPSACGAGDPKPSACGSGDPKPQPSACGAGDDPKPQPSACGAGGK